MASEYWQTSLGEILADAGIEVTNDQLQRIAEDVALSTQCESEYSGLTAQTKGKDYEREKLEKQVRELRDELEKKERTWRKATLDYLNLDDGHCTYLDYWGDLKVERTR